MGVWEYGSMGVWEYRSELNNGHPSSVIGQRLKWEFRKN
jgi:hypothetical protein